MGGYQVSLRVPIVATLILIVVALASIVISNNLVTTSDTLPGEEYKPWWQDSPDKIVVRSIAGGWNFTIFKKNSATKLAIETLDIDLTYMPWGNVLFEFGISNSFRTPSIFESRIVHVDEHSGVVIVLSRSIDVDYNQLILWIFWRDRPYFYVDFNAVFDKEVRVEGEGWEICIFNRYAQEVAALDYLGRVVYNSSIILLPDHSVMERNSTFPWVAAYNRLNGVTVATILLYAYPPAPVTYNHPDGTEVQYVFIPYLMAGIPHGEIRAKLIVYPYVAYEDPKWMKVYELSRQLYTSYYIDEVYGFQNWSQVTWFSAWKPYYHILAFNSQGKIDIMYTHIFGTLIHTTGIFSSAIPRPDTLPFFSPAILGKMVNASGTYIIDLRNARDLEYREGYGSEAVGWIAGSDLGFKVNLTISTWNNSDKFLITITWVSIKNNSIKQLYIPFVMKGDCSKVVLNDTFVDYYCRDPWHGYMGVLVSVVGLKGDNAMFYVKNNIIYIVKNEQDAVYQENTTWRLQLLVWPHHGRLNSTSDITTLNTIQRREFTARNHLFKYTNLSIAFDTIPIYVNSTQNSTILGFFNIHESGVIVKGVECNANSTFFTCYQDEKKLLLKIPSQIQYMCTANYTTPLLFASNSEIESCSYINNSMTIRFRAQPNMSLLIVGNIPKSPVNVIINNESITPTQSLSTLLNKGVNGYVYNNNIIYIVYLTQKEENMLYLTFEKEIEGNLTEVPSTSSTPQTSIYTTPVPTLITLTTTVTMIETITETPCFGAYSALFIIAVGILLVVIARLCLKKHGK